MPAQNEPRQEIDQPEAAEFDEFSDFCDFGYVLERRPLGPAGEPAISPANV